MARKIIYAFVTLLAALHVISAVSVCPDDPKCLCGGTFASEIDCNINGKIIKINMLPNTYLSIKCENASDLNYDELPIFDNPKTNFKSVTFKDCPLPISSFKDVLTKLGVTKTMALIFQNADNLTGYFNRKHFSGLPDLTKLILSVRKVTKFPDDLFLDLKKLTWLNIRSNIIYLSEDLFEPLERLETLEISHNHMTNITSNLFSHLSHLKKLSLWQSNVTWFSKDFFYGVDVLEELDLSSNELNELPASIFRPLRKLKKLTLFSNKFATLPRNLFKSNDELQTVIILNNDVKLRSLPKQLFSGLKNLKQAYVQRSGIEIVPYDVFSNSPNITNISLAHNDIKILTELVFNDQINLLELDLSYNQLSKLEPKLFSSLVRLESLNLCHNNLVTMDGSTFSSLLSLISLNMENNNIQTISPHIFDNNKQKMSISLAYNKLGLGQERLNLTLSGMSPFFRTYSLKLLNLSHNEFTRTFDDWWLNGHETLDISYNYITRLWYGEEKNETSEGNTKLCYNPVNNFLWKPIQTVIVAHNPITCTCKTYDFDNFLRNAYKIYIIDLMSVNCSLSARVFCFFKKLAVVLHLVLLIVGGTVTLIVYIIFSYKVKRLDNYLNNCRRSGYIEYDIDIKYSAKDEEFVLKEILPVLRDLKHLRVTPRPTDKKPKAKFPNFFQGFEPSQTIVVFSPNYLTSAYCKVNIKKIRGQMLKAKNTLYLFTDIGPENSIYTFLKNQRNQEYTVLWNEPAFWNKFMAMLPKESVSEDSKDEKRVSFDDCPKYTEYPTYDDKPPEYPELFTDDDNQV